MSLPNVPLASVFENPMTLFLAGLALLFLFIWYFATDYERRKRNIGTVMLIEAAVLDEFNRWKEEDSSPLAVKAVPEKPAEPSHKSPDALLDS